MLHIIILSLIFRIIDEITIHHTPDADDKFMFYALFSGHEKKLIDEMEIKII